MLGKQVFYNLPQFHQVSLLYAAELKSVLRSPISEKVQLFVRKKTEGTELFNKQDYAAALEKYYQALTLFRWIENRNSSWNNRQINDSDLVYKYEELTEEVKTCLVTTYLNIAICNLKLEQWKEAELASDEVLRIDEKNIKALYRKAQAISSPALAGADEYKKSVKLLKTALQIDPKNLVVWQKLNEVKQISEARDKFKKDLKEPAPTPFSPLTSGLDDMVAKWEVMVKSMKNTSDAGELVEFQKNLDKIKKYKSKITGGLNKSEENKLKTGKFGIDISDFITTQELKKSSHSTIERTHPLLPEELWGGWYYIFLFISIFCGLFAYSLESKSTNF